MWVYLRNSFLSIVAHREKPDILLVRARRAGDIQRVFPDAKVRRTPAADYLYRAELRRSIVGSAIDTSLQLIDYDNFKASVPDPKRHAAYARCWEAMLCFQNSKKYPDSIGFLTRGASAKGLMRPAEPWFQHLAPKRIRRRR